MAYLTCENVTLGWDGRSVAEQVNFSVSAGEYLLIVGENGSGKSTLVKTILGLQQPLSGRIVTGDGYDSGQIGYLPQQTVIQKDFPATAEEIVISGCLNKCGLFPFYRTKEKKLAAENMEKCNVTALAKRCYRELSGGQQQRVLLARALCATGTLLVLDEPVSGLDPKAAGDMYRCIAQLHRQGIAIIMVSHDLSGALADATHILHVDHTPRFFGTKDEYLKSTVGRAFLMAGGVQL